MAHSAGIQIGELSKRTGCNIETIRYYERIALLPAAARSAGRYRIYDTGDVRRLAFIRRARANWASRSTQCALCWRFQVRSA
jgi:MerR family mercuric resistance operon transcriptional regulator